VRRRPRPDERAAREARRLVWAQARVVAQCIDRWRRCLRDDDALHDVRTGLRRLRVLVRSFRTELGPLARKSIRRRLRQAMQLTSPLRDADVFILWVRTLPASPATTALIAMFGAASISSRNDAFSEINSTWRDVYRRMKAARRSGSPAANHPFGRSCARTVRAELRALETSLGGFDPVRAPGGVHEARIAAKRLRYLLEALLPRSPDVRRPVEWCRTFQGLVGEWRDATLAADYLQRCPRRQGRSLIVRRLASRRLEALTALRGFVADSVAWRIARRDGVSIARRLAQAGSRAPVRVVHTSGNT